VAAAILELMSTCTRWEGSAGALVGKLQDLSDDPRIKKLTARGLGRWLSSKANQTDLQAVGLAVDSYRSPDKKRDRGWLLSWNDPPDQKTDGVQDRPDNNLKIMSETSETSGDDLKPTPDGHSSVGHYSDITGHQADINPNNVRLMSGKCPAPEPASARGLTPPPDISDMTDIKKPCLSGGTSDDQDKRLSVPKSKDPDCGGLRVGDWVKYKGDNQTLRVQCEHSRREGVQIVSLDGETACIKSPKWIVTYRVSLNDLVLERRGQLNDRLR